MDIVLIKRTMNEVARNNSGYIKGLLYSRQIDLVERAFPNINFVGVSSTIRSLPRISSGCIV